MPTPRTNPNCQYRTVELRAAEDGAGFTGYASTPWVVDSYTTAMKPGAFRKTLKERGERTPILWQHDPYAPIGRPSVLREEKGGLYFDAAISEGTTYGRDAMTLLRDGVPLGMSFGFQTIKSRTATDDDPLDFSLYKAKADEVIVIEEVKLWEISLVTFPANELAAINDVRTVAEAGALTSLIEHIRAGSLSDDQAALVAELVAAWDARAEPEPDESTPLADERARRNRDAEITLALAAARGWTGALA